MNHPSDAYVLCSIHRERGSQQLHLALNGDVRFAAPFYWVPRELVARLDETCTQFLAVQRELEELVRSADAAKTGRQRSG